MGTIGIIAAALAVALTVLLAYASSKPDTFRVQRTTRIAAPPDRIFPLINDLHQFNTWNPYERKDPNRGIYSGPASGIGAKYAWDSKTLGIGSMEITGVSVPSAVTMKLEFIKPFAARNVVEFTLEPKGPATDITWAMHGPSPYISKVMDVVFSIDRMCGRDFEAGLANLKALVEK
jgi:hypothetical protein